MSVKVIRIDQSLGQIGPEPTYSDKLGNHAGLSPTGNKANNVGIKSILFSPTPNSGSPTSNSDEDPFQRITSAPLPVRSPTIKPALSRRRLTFNVPGEDADVLKSKGQAFVEKTRQLVSKSLNDLHQVKSPQEAAGVVRSMSQHFVGEAETAEISTAIEDIAGELSKQESRIVDGFLRFVFGNENSWIEKTAHKLENQGLHGLASVFRLIMGILKTAVLRPLGIGLSAAMGGLAFAIALILLPFMMLLGLGGLASETSMKAAAALAQTSLAACRIMLTSAKEFVLGLKNMITGPFARIYETLAVASYAISSSVGVGMLALASIPLTLSIIPLYPIGQLNKKAEAVSDAVYRFAIKSGKLGIGAFNYPHALFEKGLDAVKRYIKTHAPQAIQNAHNGKPALNARIVKRFEPVKNATSWLTRGS